MGNITNHLESSADVRSGKPRIAGTRITVSDIVIMHLRLGLSIEEIAGKYLLPLSAVYDALAYYHDHRAEVEQTIEEDVAFVEAFKRNNPTPLQEKLQALTHG
jgi:uncharacterized protein (DUF433 family)